MAKKKKKLMNRQKRKKKENEYIFINGKQKKVKKTPTIDEMDVDDFILANADPLWYHINEMWEYMPEYRDENYDSELSIKLDWHSEKFDIDDDDMPF